jgi:hypothetical protein
VELAMIYVAVAFGGLLLLGVVFKMVDSAKILCPACGAQGRFSKFMIRRCRACKAFVDRHGEEWRVIGSGYIAKVAQFPVFVSDLKEPSLWQIPWPGVCCVCRQPTVKSTTISIVGKIVRVVGPYVDRAKYSFEFYHCPEHAEGVRFETFSAVAEPDREGDNLQFKSYDFWREFVSLNGK